MKQKIFTLFFVLTASVGTMFAKDILVTDFTKGQGDWKTFSYGDKCPSPVWQQTSQYGMKATAYIDGTRYETKCYLVSPVFDCSDVTDVTLTFEHAWRYGNKEQLYVVIRKDSSTESADLDSGTTELEVNQWPTGNNWNFVKATVDLSAYADWSKVQIEFVYTSDNTDAPTWEIKNVSITGENNQYEYNGVYYHLNKTAKTATVMYKSYDSDTDELNTGWNITTANIASQIIVNSVTYDVIGIEPYAFYGCSMLTQVSLPNTIKTIGDGAFRASAVQNITLPESVISIGKDAFNSTDLHSFTFNKTLTLIEDGILCNCPNLANVIIPNQITKIEGWAFYNCPSLTQIVIPENVTEIGWDAFLGCTGLKQVTMESTTPPTNGTGVFKECSNLERIYVPCGKINDYQNAWPEYADLFTHPIVSSTPVITSFTGGKRSYVETTECGYLVTAIPDKDYYFANWTNSMTGINPPDNPILVRREIDIDNFVPIFMKWLKITKKTDTSMGTISGPTKGKLNESVTLEAKPKTNYFFVQWSDGNKDNPRTIVLTQDTAFTAEFMKTPLVIRLDPVTSKNWENVYLRVWTDEKELVAEDAYYYESHPEIPKNYTTMYKEEDNWFSYILYDEMPSSMYIQFSNGTDKTVAITNTKSPVCYSLKSSSGTAIAVNTVNCPIDVQVGNFGYTIDLLNKKAMLKRYLTDKYYLNYTELDYTKLAGNLTIQSPIYYKSQSYSVTGISGSTFWDCTGLTSVTIPNSVKYIGVQAFEGCTGLMTVSLPGSLTEMYGAVFSMCTGLKNITFPGSLTAIPHWTFQGCTGLESVTIPNSITKIEDEAFYACGGLKSITCEATTPPLCGENVFEGETNYPGVEKTTCVLYVPKESVNAYKAADTWKEFYHIVPIGTVPTDIEEIYPSTYNGEIHKLLRNGQILILRGEKTYTLTGQEVR